jgi:sulfatase maturation enzyme AslB (radical SAM superfamily)
MIKNRQRYEPDIYMQIFENVRFIKNYNINLIAHTLVTPLNIDYIEDICKELISQDIKTLTLYQFRDYSFIKNREQYILTNNEFISVCTQIYNKYHDRLDIKYEVASERDEKYFFVSSKGIVYTTNGLNTLRHEYLGSIFDSDIAEKWNKYNDFNKCQLSTQEKINRECKNHGNKNY